MGMTFTEEILAEDEKKWGYRNILAELKYCGNHMRDRKIMTNQDIRFYAYIMRRAYDMLKEQENLKQKMWNALYAEEDNLENKFARTEEHNDWFFVYRPWLQRGFEIAINVIAEQDGM